MFATRKYTKEEVEQQKLIAQMANDVTEMKGQIKELNDKVDSKYVSKEEFSTVKAIVYGEVALILSSVFLAIIYLVVKR